MKGPLVFTLALLTAHEAADTRRHRCPGSHHHDRTDRPRLGRATDRLVRVTAGTQGFGFWADEVSAAAPILVRGFDLAITESDDTRDLANIRPTPGRQSHPDNARRVRVGGGKLRYGRRA